jgi:hypothetical protein
MHKSSSYSSVFVNTFGISAQLSKIHGVQPLSGCIFGNKKFMFNDVKSDIMIAKSHTLGRRGYKPIVLMWEHRLIEKMLTA